jgi:hypothetical protein
LEETGEPKRKEIIIIIIIIIKHKLNLHPTLEDNDKR